MSVDRDIARIRHRLKHYTTKAEPTAWLDTGSTNLNAVMGSPDHGIPYGKMIELYGPQSHGKTMLAILLAALAQKKGATVIWIDLENSFDTQWVTSQGLDPEQVYLFRPQIGTFGKETGEVRLQSAEELFREVEEIIKLIHKRDPERHMFLVCDSVAAILVEDESSQSLDDHSMRTRMSLPMFLGALLRRWSALALNYGVIMLFINQIRLAPGSFGNPEYTPGGRALGFYCATRVDVRRVKGGRIVQTGKTIGLRGRLKNIKNKAGSGSFEGAETGFVKRFNTRKWSFPSVKEVRKEAE